MRFLSLSKKMGYAERDGCHIVEIPYQSGEFSMIWATPISQKKSCQRVANIQEFQAMLAAMKLREVRLTMPEFMIESPKYSLSGLIQKYWPEIDKALLDRFQIDHSAIVKVDDKGTVAVAVTTASASTLSGVLRQEPPVVVLINHPSQYFLVHNHSNEILFIGDLDSPDPI